MKTLLTTLAIMTIASGIGATPGLAQSTSGFVLHVTPASYGGCGTVNESAVDCGAIDVEGDNSGVQFVFVLTFGFNDTNIPGWGGSGDAGISGAQFGITYDDASVTVQNWALCTGGSEIPQTDPISWPAPNTGNAATWADACYDSPSPDDFTNVGYFTVDSFSDGLMFIQGDPRDDDRVAVTDCETTLYVVDPLDAYSSASMNGANPDAIASCAGAVPTLETTWGQIKSTY